jgi:predicted Zn-ribbon and HTH transcriptional regulator
MIQPHYEMQTVVEKFLPRLSEERGISSEQLKVLSAIQNCRTSVMGGHEHVCKDCGQVHYAYNSCRNRHCPKCQGIDLERWVMAREADLLPVKYFHVIFTLPEQLNELCMFHPQAMYEVLFQTVWNVLRSFALDDKWLGGQMGAIAILHTWSQTLTLHPHVHLIVPAGGIIANRTWKTSKGKGKFLFDVKQLSHVFRGRFVAALRKWAKVKQQTLDKQMIDGLFEKGWIVYAKQPFGGPKQVIKYLGQYTRRIAISNYRIKEITEDHVIFSYKDRRDKNKQKTMRLKGEEFLRRFLLHTLPNGFIRIRHYGFLSSHNKTMALAAVRKQLNAATPERKKLSWQQIAKIRLGFDPCKCSSCGGEMVIYKIIPRHRAPPLPLWNLRQQKSEQLTATA